MKQNSNVLHIADYEKIENEAWENVVNSLSKVTVLDQMNPKGLPRTGKLMYRALLDLLFHLREYDHKRLKK
ncbi:MAG TPA: hypothetical protein VH815_08745 [Acidobacteriota bacterium]|jgi:hypothetical protein